jgi:DNA-directed RNA polymerase subunit L
MTEQDFIFESDVKNDSIDIYAEPKISIKKMPTKKEEEFHIQLEGENIDNSVVNAIRRTILMQIPSYGFYRSNIYIENDKTRTMYNNDMIYNLIETLPIFDIPNYFDLENPEIFLPDDVMKSIFGRFIQEKNKDEQDEETSTKIDTNKRLFKIELSINTKNTTGSDKFLTTHDAVLKVDGKISNSYLKRDPISILVLKTAEEISLRAEANLGISKIHAAYETTTNVIIKEINSMKYELIYETIGQLDKNIIFTKSCIILIKKLEMLNKFIKKKFSKEPPTAELIEIQLFGEDHTLGNLLATALQKCDLIKEAGYVMPHPFADQILIRYKLSKKAKIDPIKVINDVVDYLIKLFEYILNNAFKHSK